MRSLAAAAAVLPQTPVLRHGFPPSVLSRLTRHSPLLRIFVLQTAREGVPSSGASRAHGERSLQSASSPRNNSASPSRALRPIELKAARRKSRHILPSTLGS